MRPSLPTTILSIAAAAVLVLGGPVAAASAAPNASDWPASISIPGAYGVAFSQNGEALYAAQRGKGVTVAYPSGNANTIIESRTSFMAVGTEANGDLLLTVDSDPNIYRLNIHDVMTKPSDYQQNGYWKTQAQVVYTSSRSSYLYSLAAAPDGSIYYSTHQDRQINVIRDGVSTPLLAQSFDFPFTGFSMLADGGLAALAKNGTVYKVSATALAAGNVAPSSLEILTTGVSGYGIAAFSNGTFYDSQGTKRKFEGKPATRPGAPTDLTATTGDGQVTVTWEAPEDDGGAPITSYTVSAVNPDGTYTVLTDTDKTTATLSGLTNGKAINLAVAAENTAGGTYSSPIAVTPFAVAVTYTSGNTTLTPNSSLEVGQSITATGSALPPGAPVELVLHSTPVTLASGAVNPDGTFKLTGVIPSATPAGAHTLTLTVAPAGDAARSAEQAITITTAASPSETPTTENTAQGATTVGVGATSSATTGVTPAGKLAATGTEDPAPAIMIATLALLLGLGLSFTHQRRSRGSF